MQNMCSSFLKSNILCAVKEKVAATLAMHKLCAAVMDEMTIKVLLVGLYNMRWRDII